MSKLVEPIATTLIQIMQRGMPAILTKIAAEYQTLDGQSSLPGQAPVSVPLPPIVNYYFGERHNMPEMPCIVVMPVDSRIDNERFHYTWADYDHTIMVDVLVQSDNEDVISRQVHRYARAIWEVLFGNQTDQFGGLTQAISIRPVHGTITPLVPKDGLLYTGWRWILEIHRYDDLT